MTPMTIGAVITLLQPEFPEITVSKLRFLEAEGLVEPQRTQTGYRRFSADDVARIRYILRAQRDRYLPLKVIREELATIVTFAEEDTSPQQSLPIDELHDALTDDAAETLTRAQLRRMVACEPQLLDELATHGLLGEEPYDQHDLTIARSAVKLVAHGLEVRHLRMFRQFNEREIDLIEQLLAPVLRHPHPERIAEAKTSATAILAVGDDLHHALRARALRTIFGQ